jgi:hypothetical protein
VLLGQVGLAQPSGWLPFAAYTVLPGSGMTTSPAYPYSVTISRALTIRTWYQLAYVATTNNGSNYWTLDLVEPDLATVHATIDTSAISADTWTMIDDTTINADVSRSDLGLYVRITKTGSPGALYLQGPAVFVT